MSSEKKIQSLVKRLREAANAYYNTDRPLMTDDEYDTAVEDLRKLAPSHSFFTEVGANPHTNVQKLPVPMASLDKKKPETVPSLLKGDHVLMDKLDGISALWVYGHSCKPALYLRGNGLEGQNVSHCIQGIRGLVQNPTPLAIVRGELIVPRNKGLSSARNWVNGVLHQKTPSKEDLQQIHFLAYQVCTPSNLTRSQQMTWLASSGFEVVWHQRVSNLSSQQLQTIFQERRSKSEYECDGIVVGTDTIPMAPTTSNPKDAFAFKMPVEDQKATTIIREVDWTSSRTGTWIPRLRFDPVKIGAATIEYCTGFHASFIRSNRLGPGAKVIIRRSGDVIPTLDTVLEPAATWFEPPTGRWKWDETETHALDTTTEATPEKLALEMAHILVSLCIEGYSKTSTRKLVDSNLRTFKTLLGASKTTLQQILGQVNGEKLHTALATLHATELQWLRAYCGWPKGFGESRILATLTLEKDVTKWGTLTQAPPGQTMTTFRDVQKAVPGYLAWRQEIGLSSAPSEPSESSKQSPSTQTVPKKGTYVMTGFRDADLQKQLESIGWSLEDTVRSTTGFLLVPDGAKETTKVKAAQKAGIRILPRSQVQTLF